MIERWCILVLVLNFFKCQLRVLSAYIFEMKCKHMELTYIKAVYPGIAKYFMRVQGQGLILRYKL